MVDASAAKATSTARAMRDRRAHQGIGRTNLTTAARDATSMANTGLIARPTVTLVLSLRVCHTGDVHGDKFTNRNQHAEGGQAHSSAPKASEAENRLIAPRATRASLFWTQRADLWNMDASMHQLEEYTPVGGWFKTAGGNLASSAAASEPSGGSWRVISLTTHARERRRAYAYAPKGAAPHPPHRAHA